MNSKIQQIKSVRQFVLKQIAELSTDQLNKIPEGYNNNIVWNLAHLICAQQSLCYLRAGQPVVVDEKYITLFRTGTKPGGSINSNEINSIKELFLSTVEKLQTDLDKKLFENYTASPNIRNAYGIELNSIEDALDFLLYHEGYHSGYIASLKQLVK